MTIFVRALQATDKSSVLSDAVNCVREGVTSKIVFDVDPASFHKIPGSPFAYWVSEALRDLFSILPPFEAEDRMARAGLQSSDDFRFLRTNWEVPLINQKWIHFAKGGKFSPFYADVNMKINWKDDGNEIKAWAGSLYNGSHWSRIIKNTHLYFKPGMFQTLRADQLAPHITPSGCIFSDNGTQAFSDMHNMLSLTAILNSSGADFLHKLLLGRNGFGLYRNGTLAKLPIPDFNEHSDSLSRCSKNCWSLKRKIDEIEETSNAFVLPLILRRRFDKYDLRSTELDISLNMAEIDEIVFRLYGFDTLDIASAHGDRGGSNKESLEGIEDAADGNHEEDVSPRDECHSLLSWTVGVAFGRFDWRLATAERIISPEPSPFDPLPARSVGMLPDGLEPFHHHAGFLVDDPGHPYDLGRIIEEVLQRVDAHIPLSVQHWLQRDFFPAHLKQYTRSKRKAPIYWQISTASGNYSIWLYAPAVTKDTFFRLKQDILEQKIISDERALAALLQGGNELSSRDRKSIENQQKLVEELKQLTDEVKRVAPLWNPNLDDGTVLTMAPLWRMVGNHKPWQKELRARWGELQLGKHDWSRQAMHLWPERVVPKCAEDRSIAIAHDLEDVFWFKSEAGKWAKRDVPSHAVSDIVRERSSDAVKEALKALLEAPEPTAGSRLRSKA